MSVVTDVDERVAFQVRDESDQDEQEEWEVCQLQLHRLFGVGGVGGVGGVSVGVGVGGVSDVGVGVGRLEVVPEIKKVTFFVKKTFSVGDVEVVVEVDDDLRRWSLAGNCSIGSKCAISHIK